MGRRGRRTGGEPQPRLVRRRVPGAGEVAASSVRLPEACVTTDGAPPVVGMLVTVREGLRAHEVEVARITAPAARQARDDVGAFIEWGDGTGVETARVRWHDTHGAVVASHVFPMAGRFDVVVHVVWPAGGARATTTAVVGSAAERLVPRLYAHLTGCPANAAVLARIEDGGNPERLVQAILADPASQRAGVEGAYLALLRRPPTDSEIERAVARLRGGDSMDTLRARLIGSREYFRTIARESPKAFVEMLYRDVLGRRPEATELETALSDVVTDAARVRAAGQVLASQEAWLDTLRRHHRALLGTEPSTRRLLDLAGRWRGDSPPEQRLSAALSAIATDLLGVQRFALESAPEALLSPDAADSATCLNLLVSLLSEEAREALALYRAKFEVDVGRPAQAADFHLDGPRLTMGVWWADPVPAQPAREAWLAAVSQANADAAPFSASFFTSRKFLNAAAQLVLTDAARRQEFRTKHPGVELSSVVIEMVPGDQIVTKTEGIVTGSAARIDVPVSFSFAVKERLFVASELPDCERVSVETDYDKRLVAFLILLASSDPRLDAIPSVMTWGAGLVRDLLGKQTDEEGPGCALVSQLPKEDTSNPLATLAFRYGSIDVFDGGVVARARVVPTLVPPELQIAGPASLRRPSARYSVATKGMRFLKKITWTASEGYSWGGSRTLAAVKLPPPVIARPDQEAKSGQRIVDPSTLVTFPLAGLAAGTTAFWTLSVTATDLSDISKNAELTVAVRVPYPLEGIIEPPVPESWPQPLPWGALFTRWRNPVR